MSIMPKRQIILMADIIKSSQKNQKDLMEGFKKVVELSRATARGDRFNSCQSVGIGLF